MRITLPLPLLRRWSPPWSSRPKWPTGRHGTGTQSTAAAVPVKGIPSTTDIPSYHLGLLASKDTFTHRALTQKAAKRTRPPLPLPHLIVKGDNPEATITPRALRDPLTTAMGFTATLSV